MIRMNQDKEWMRRMAELEEGCCVSAGGWISRLATVSTPTGRPEAAAGFDPKRVALARFVEFSRRKLGLTVQAFAAKASVDLAEVIQAEDGDAPAPEPRVVFAIASLLKADARKLMELAGHVTARDAKLGEEAVRFAAWSQRTEPLTKEEERVLREFARIVIQSSDRS